jgi:drug/metabolite transporter (DMT)-like permease
LATVFALASSALYGVSDVAGGLLARRVNFATVALVGQVGALAFMVVVSLTTAAPSVEVADLMWGGLSGVGTGLGMTFLFRGLSRGDMSVVVPIVAVGGIALPVLVGVTLLGDRPSLLSWSGIAAAVPALWLVTRTGRFDAAQSAAVVDGLTASVGIALQYIALAQAGPNSGTWPVTAGRLTATFAIVPLAVYAGGWSWPRLPPALGAAATGILAAMALVCYLLATHRELIAVAVVLSSLYPAIPVVLGITALQERPTTQQAVGLVVAGAAVGLLALG